MKSYQIRIEDGHHIVNMSKTTPPTLEQALQAAVNRLSKNLDITIEGLKEVMKEAFPNER